MERLRQSRFADPRVRGDQDDLTVPCLCLSPSAVKELELFGAANERCLISAQRLEPAAGLALANHAKRCDRRCQSSDLDLTEAVVFEQAPDQSSRILRDQNLIRPRERLQPCREVRGVPDHCLLLGSSRADQVADYRNPRRQPDAHLQRLRRSHPAPASTSRSVPRVCCRPFVSSIPTMLVCPHDLRGGARMSKPSPRRPATIERRTFLKGATAGLAVTSGLEGILASQRAPAFAQGAEIHLLQWVDFIPEGDAELRRQCAEYSSQTKTKVTVETINANDLQARITAAIQSGSGPDIIMMLHNWPHLYASALGDVSDLCEWKAKDQGGYYAHSEAAAKSGKRWLALPYTTGGSLIAYRRSWFAEAGANAPPKTLEEYRKIGMALKKKGKPVGQTLGHTFGDAPTWTYPLTWTFGGMETDPSGKKVVINSPKTVEAVKWMTSFWKDACDEGALAWDDTNNNRAFHANE